MPPVAGSIKWSRSLFARVKQTMQKLQDVEAELLQGETGQEVTCIIARCIAIADAAKIVGTGHKLHAGADMEQQDSAPTQS